MTHIRHITPRLNTVFHFFFIRFFPRFMDGFNRWGMSEPRPLLASLFAFFSALFITPSYAIQMPCEAELHNNLSIEAESVVLDDNQNRFKIDQNGNLFVDVHKVAINQEQRDSLTQYNQTIRNDIPFLRHSLTSQLHESWEALDNLIVMELGTESSLRGHLKRYHQHYQEKMKQSFFDRNLFPSLNHQVLSSTLAEVATVMPVFISMIPSHGLQDMFNVSKNDDDQIRLMSLKMKDLQMKLVDMVALQHLESQKLHKEVCNRFTDWERQETVIASLIPALSDWKTVTLKGQ